MDFGIEPEEFKEEEMLEWFKDVQMNQSTKQTEGIFAPWFIFKEDFTSIGGHDPLFAHNQKKILISLTDSNSMDISSFRLGVVVYII